MIRECKVCKTLYNDETYIGTSEICHDCRNRLEGTYARLHDYIRDHAPHKKIDVERMAKDTGTNAAEIKIIIELGWLERDIQTYTRTASERQILAEKFERELGKVTEHKSIMTYGGKIYRRKKTRKGTEA